MTIGYIIFALFAVSIMYSHYRGRVRFSALRQSMTHTNFIAPYNMLVCLFSKTPNRPILTVENFPELLVLRENWQMIRDEALTMSDDGHIAAAPKLNDLAFNSFFRTGWKRFYLKWYDDFMPSANELCPKTVELLKSTPSIKAAMFASLPPGAKLMKHRDPYAGSLRYHLGLFTPNDDECYIKVDDQFYSWRDGEDILFDETYIHEAYNNTDKPRVVLFCDVHRPLKTRWMNTISHFVSDKVIRASASQNDQTEKVGFLNKVFEKAYVMRTYSRKVKHWNRPVYKGLKYTLFFGMIYIIFF